MTIDTTTIIDIYEASGGTVNEDRTQVTVDGTFKPFKIELLVIPVTLETSGFDGPDMVTLGVILDPEHSFETTPMGTYVHDHHFDVSVKLPVSQVKIIKE